MQVEEFERELASRAGRRYAEWQRVDLHNHSPSSRDYAGTPAVAARDSAEQIRRTGLSVVMFTDHGRLPEPAFIDEVRKLSGALILRGVELNIFVDAWGTPKPKVGKNAFFHLLVGFDPDENADYWLERVYRECGGEARSCGTVTVFGVSTGVAPVLDVLSEAHAICIPAHLHSTPDAFRSRSIDDIYDDPQFLSLVPRFSALEVTDPRTAEYFDGQNSATRHLLKTCVRSSDSHRPLDLGTRPTWMQLEKRSFGELKAALELRFRVSLTEPSEPDAYVVGLHIDGSFLNDIWLRFSPHCNVMIGVKGSGKTAVLECLRFALGTDVPKANSAQVQAHLQHVLGAAGHVTALVKRADGTMVLIKRGIADSNYFHITFSDGRVERVTRPEALGFPASVLGWHEIEHAAVDADIRRQYMDAIAGRERIRQLEADTLAVAEQIRFKHEQAAGRYKSFRDLQRQTDEHEQIRRGLEELRDANLIALRDSYDLAISHRDELRRLIDQLAQLAEQADVRMNDVLKIDRPVLAGASPLEESISPVRQNLAQLEATVAEWAGALKDSAIQARDTTIRQRAHADTQYAEFVARYEAAVASLSDDQRSLLNAHRKVLEQTQALPALRAQRDQQRNELIDLLKDLESLCDGVTERLDTRSRIRKEAIRHFSADLVQHGVLCEVRTRVRTENHQEYENRYREGSRAWSSMRTGPGERSTLHRALRASYSGLLADLFAGDRLFFETPEFSHYITLFENDDLAISFDPDASGANYRPIDQLSAGQRCTAFFPILLRLRQGPLVIDQPEDNLDNRHIASRIAPILLADKRARQIILTSHNANLVVLSDPESILVFEGQGPEGHLVVQGFLATRHSVVTKPVLDILDGGERALELRYQKYGRKI